MLIRCNASRQFVDPDTKKRTYAFKNRKVELDDKWADESFVAHWFFAGLKQMGILEVLEEPAVVQAAAAESAVESTASSTKAKTTKSTKTAS